jgi:WD40-like Beta Propeller Repeat
MSDARAFDDRLRAWLVDGPEAAPPDLIDLVLDEVPAVRRSFRSGRAAGWPPRTGRWLIAAAAVVAVTVVATATLLPRQPSFGVPASPSPTGQTSHSPSSSTSPSPSLPFDPCRPGAILAAPGSRPGFDPETVRGRIAYRADTEIRAVDPARPQDVLVIDPGLRADPTSWSADGTRLLLLGESPEFGTALLAAGVLSSDGSIVRLTDWGTGSFAPDGKTIVYSVPGGGLCRASADGSSSELLAFDMAEPLDGPPAWSPDGSVIAFMDFVENSPVYGHHAYGVSFINPDGSNFMQLEVHFGVPEGGGGLNWSSNGKSLAFWLPKGAEGTSGQIYVLDVASLQTEQITRDGDNRWPTWSPDGSRIAFVRDGALVTSKPDGSDVVSVPGIAPDGSIAWNPIQ